MKRCPECRRDYYDDTLLYCLEDGTALVQGSVPSPDEPATEILSEPPALAGGEFDEAKTRAFIHTTQAKAEPRQSVGDASERPSFSANRATKPLIAAAVVLAVLVGGFFAYRYLSTAGGGQINSIAVLPFENRSGNADSEYLSDGLAESLIYRLSQLPDLKVSPTSSVFRYKGKETDPQVIAKELGVDSVITGRITQRGDNLTISVNLVDTRNGKSLWGEQYERKMSELLNTQREIASEIANKLQLKLTGADSKGITKKYTDNNEAYQLYLKGRFSWNKRMSADIRKAIEFFNQAIEIDPSFALAFSGLADCYNLQGLREVDPRDGFPKAKAMALKALEIDDSLAEPHASLGFVKHRFDLDFAGAEKEFKRAIELNPSYATAHQWYAFYFASVGKFTEGVEEMKRAQEIDPLSLEINADLGYMFYFARQNEQAMAQLQKTVALDAGFAYTHIVLALVYLQKEMLLEAIAEGKEANRIAPEGPFSYAILCHVTALAGQRSEAQQLFARLQEMSKQKYVNPIHLAWAYTGFGDKDKALEMLNKGLEERSSSMALLKIDPGWDVIRDDPRYKDLLKRTNVPE